jgi:aspartyl-tRNA(Asn)/glutamyl-tRNA(Gln) amidotransferase subunit A
MPAPANDVFFATIPELNARLVKKEFSAEELARVFAERLEQLGPRYNALALSLKSQALRQAHVVDKDFKNDRLRGPLQGIPYAVKDLLSYAGLPTTWGAKPYATQVFDFNSTVVDKLTSVGAVIAAKLSMVELAGGGGYRTPAASLTGPGLNPWDRTRWSGGSSSGCRRRRSRPRPLRHWFGNLRLHRHPRCLLRRHRPAPHLRPGRTPRRHGPFLDPR